MHTQIIIDEAVNGWMLTIIPKEGPIQKEIFEQYSKVLEAVLIRTKNEMINITKQMKNDSMEVI